MTDTNPILKRLKALRESKRPEWFVTLFTACVGGLSFGVVGLIVGLIVIPTFEYYGFGDPFISEYLIPASILLGFVVAAVAAWKAYRFSRWEKYAKGMCRKCGYDLRGNTSGVCPECGATVFRGS